MHERLNSLTLRTDEARLEVAAHNSPRIEVIGTEERVARRSAAERLTSLRRATDGLFSEAVWALHRGLVDNPDSAELHDLLGEFYAERYADAERRGALEELPLYRALLRSFDNGRWERWLGTGCELTVASLPEGEDLELLRLDNREGRLRPSESLGKLAHETVVALPPGRYAIAPILEGGEIESLSVRRRWLYPLLLHRGDRRHVVIDLRGEDQAGDAFAFVPGGPALVGGDPQASGSGVERSIELRPYAIARHPVTVGAYDRFLSALRGQSAALARRRRPEDFDQQRRAGPRRPVVGVPLESAQAYASWLSDATGRPIRLPTADEWEKAVRGADGRIYPWGDSFGRDSCASILTCEPNQPPPEVGSFPSDRSPFGLLDSAGGVWEWTAEEDNGRALVVGGSILSEAGACRAASRRDLSAQCSMSSLGFRVVMDLGEAVPKELA